MIRPIFLALSLITAALSAGILTPPAAAAPAPSTYRLRPEDVIEITVLGPAQLDKTVTILPDGTISYPRLGTIKAAGKTPEELKAFLLKGLDRFYNILDITVSVKQLRTDRVTVNGAVKTPGIYDIRRGWTIHELMAAAGGLANTNGPPAPEQIRATLLRKSGQRIPLSLGQLLAEQGAPNLPVLEPDDVLTVEDLSIHVWVDGQVAKPGPYTLPPGASALDALRLAGGPTDKAGLSKAIIRRGTQQIPLNLRAAQNGATDPLPALQRGDTLTVPENRNRILIMGGVQRQGPFLIPEGEPLHLIDAIGLAGGPVPRVDLSKVSLARKVNGEYVPRTINVKGIYSKKGGSANNEVLQPGDLIHVPDPRQPKRSIWDVIPFVSLVLP